MRTVLHQASPRPDGWIRAVGYHDSVAGEIVLGWTSFAAHTGRVQHRSGALWILNSAAL